jgi:uncharacterized membrane protein (UPF0127 family)
LGRSLKIIACIWVLFGGALMAGQGWACQNNRIDLRGDWGQTSFTIVVANTPETRAQGLMFVEKMPRRAGMLFVYERPQRVSFWMRNTKIPLDMIFADSRGVVRHVHSNAVPLDETPIPGGRGIQYVLEINGGIAQTLGIGPGTQLKAPALDQSKAIWRCDAN